MWFDNRCYYLIPFYFSIFFWAQSQAELTQVKQSLTLSKSTRGQFLYSLKLYWSGLILIGSSLKLPSYRYLQAYLLLYSITLFNCQSSVSSLFFFLYENIAPVYFVFNFILCGDYLASTKQSLGLLDISFFKFLASGFSPLTRRYLIPSIQSPELQILESITLSLLVTFLESLLYLNSINDTLNPVIFLAVTVSIMLFSLSQSQIVINRVLVS